jgi:1,4-dihydroxy-2-naphthoate octaprenyltransferase
MSGASGVMRDERTAVVESASYRLAYLFIAFALLLDVMYRSLVRRESPWELLAIIIVGGTISTVYQGGHKVLTRHSVRLFVLTSLIAGLVAAVVAALRFLH